LAALLSLAASDEFLLVAVGAAFAAVFYQLHPERVGLGRSS
jgi:hypothetical protein